ncbi:NifB/NifX family molybdenum-iron cluster-binding protein [Luteococcus sp. OSA5]|uniref:NifB/NifX family molybdenum-iron cluster-binding protein n=1 Tax=Luteococcus sp. OSA5 TaxID=3401630 RepID=UPI003B433541
MIVATPTTADGQTAAAWGKAHWIGLADVRSGAEGPEVVGWQIHEVAWDESHDAGTHGSHHARIVRFLKENQVQAIVVDHMGEGMQRVVRNMQIPLLPATPGDAQASVLAAVRAATA